MPITILFLLQFAEIFAAYTALTVLLPAVLFRRILRGRRLSEQFLMCSTIGNFYIINLVFLVFLLHIANVYALVGLTVVLSLLIWSRVNRVSLRGIWHRAVQTNRKLARGSLGKMGFLDMIWIRLVRSAKAFARWFYRKAVQRPFAFLCFAAVIGALFWIYGRQLMLVYGYRTSDIPVHMNWINQMSRGTIFSSGVYPFGFHCIVYYLHTVLRIDTYVILCVFYFVQVIYIHLVLLAMLKAFCRSAYLPYAGVLVYILANFWAEQTQSRFYSSLPQEFGMIFVIPSIYFLVRFFQTEKHRLKTRENGIMRACFALAFALTLSIHFYGTMIAGLCCIGIAVGYCGRFLQKEYFRRIMLTGILSILLAVYPMVLAYAGGTPLQGSLGWGLGVITGEIAEEVESESVQTETEVAAEVGIEAGYETEIGFGAEAGSAFEAERNFETGSRIEGQSERKIDLVSKLQSLASPVLRIGRTMAGKIRGEIFQADTAWTGRIVLGMLGALVLLGLLFYRKRKIEYGGLLVSAGCCMEILTILLCARSFGLPALMDSTRCSVYYTYLLAGAGTLLADGLLAVLIPAGGIQWLSAGLTVLLVAGLYQGNLIKELQCKSDYITNGAYLCLTNIIRENEDEKWTIVSANDELQMALDHGWHYELNTFLRSIEYLDGGYTTLRIPTEKVYFFIEKIPVNYSAMYEGSGQSVSKKGASQWLPNQSGILMYHGESRWILMSRMYYWAQAFQEKYPNEMRVYYESEDFICYELEQNMYHQYDLAIDYGYNQAPE